MTRSGTQKVCPLYRGAIGVTFNQDPRRAEKMLLSVIRSAPRSEEAYEAYEWLSHLYFYRGQYRSLLSIMERRWAEFPNKEERPQEQAALAGFRGLPNQILETTRPSALRHESGSIFPTLRWNREGTVEIGDKPELIDIRKSNLLFDDDHLVVTAIVQGREICATLDTGALTTDLYKPFADEFASLLAEKGKKDSTEVRGVGHAETFDSMTIPELRIQLAGLNTMLSPAHVLLKSIGAKRCLGNFGMDLLKQARAFKIDFGAMTLRLESGTALK